MLMADGSFDDGSEFRFGIGFDESGSFSDCEFRADEW
jgi:hypothetical protein